MTADRGGVLLTEKTGGFTKVSLGLPHSHLSLTAAGQIVDARGPNQWGNVPPRRMGSGASPVMRKLDGSHHEVKVSPREWNTVALWVDTQVPFRRNYGEQMNPGIGHSGNLSAAAKEVIGRRCFTCHEKHPGHGERWYGSLKPGFRARDEGRNYLFYPAPGPSPEIDQPLMRWGKTHTAAEYESFWRETFSRNEAELRRGSAIIVNWDRPDKSLVLLAPLAKTAGGYATASMDDVKSGKARTCPVLFQSTNDPDYKTILDGMSRVPPSKPGNLAGPAQWETYWQSLWWKPLPEPGR
jgi:hypothetical protein